MAEAADRDAKRQKTMPLQVTLLDYGAGNVRSVVNAIESLGYEVKKVETVADIENAQVLVFPGVGAFGSAMAALDEHGYRAPLKAYLAQGKPYFGICLGMQTLFEGSEESPGVEGLGVIPGTVELFDAEALGRSVPQIGWNEVKPQKRCCVNGALDSRFYFVHSFRAPITDANREHVLTTTDYGEEYISSVATGNLVATQFHPEKSGNAGLALLDAFFKGVEADAVGAGAEPAARGATVLGKRVIACLDVRTNDSGDLVVTKGDQYDVREKGGDNNVRNLGKPVALCDRYYREGADEVAFLNITSFRSGVLEDMPMLQVLEAASRKVFVPLTVGGGIREYTDASTGQTWSALDVAARYFRAGADKVSIGSDAVYAAEAWYANGRTKTGASSIEQIAERYGRQAVVVSIDPRRVYVDGPDGAPGHSVLEVEPGRFAWYQCTVRGGREGRDVDAVQLAKAVEALGAGEILLNCVDMDGQKAGYDLGLVSSVRAAVRIPVIASSGAGAPEHFSQVLRETGCDAALAAGIFHRGEVQIQDVKRHLADEGIPVRA